MKFVSVWGGFHSGLVSLFWQKNKKQKVFCECMSQQYLHSSTVIIDKGIITRNSKMDRLGKYHIQLDSTMEDFIKFRFWCKMHNRKLQWPKSIWNLHSRSRGASGTPLVSINEVKPIDKFLHRKRLKSTPRIQVNIIPGIMIYHTTKWSSQ
jgi:hypothetical protein